MEYRDGIKSEGDKIGMPCTHSTVIIDTRNSQPKRINDTSPILSHQMTTKLHNQFLCVEMRREKSLGGFYKHVSGMLNINLTLRGGGSWYVTFGSLHKLLHSHSRVTASSTTAGLACYGYIKRSTVIDKLGYLVHIVQ